MSTDPMSEGNSSATATGPSTPGSREGDSAMIFWSLAWLG
jgi:hypothetical protein